MKSLSVKKVTIPSYKIIEWPRLLENLYKIEEEKPTTQNKKDGKLPLERTEIDKNIAVFDSVDLRINNSASILDQKVNEKDSSRSSMLNLRKNISENYLTQSRER